MQRSLVVLVAAALLGSASVAATGPARAAGSRAHWALREQGLPPAVAADDSGNGNHGTPSGGVTGDGSGFGFDGTGRVVVPDAPNLNPGTADFSFSVTFTTTLPLAGTDYDLLRKGFARTRGGEYKAEVVNVKGRAKGLCLVKDSLKHTGSVRLGGRTLANGKPHTITCSKTATGVTIAVDGLTPRTRAVTGGLGVVGNGAALTLGAKDAAGGDWFVGRLIEATLQ
jgi:hypothetical protein